MARQPEISYNYKIPKACFDKNWNPRKGKGNPPKTGFCSDNRKDSKIN